MDESIGLQDWELLPTSDAALISAEDSKFSQGIDDDSEDGAIKSDYFTLDSGKLHHQRARLEAEEEEGGVDSEKPSWLDPDSDSRYLDWPRTDMGFAATGLPRRNSGGFWSDDSSDGHRSLTGSEKESGGSITEVGVEKFDVGKLNSGKSTGLDESGGSEGVGNQKQDELCCSELVKTRDGSDSSAPMMNMGNGDPNNPSVGEGEKRGMVWWKIPFELLKFCAIRVRPIWGISIVAAFMGIFMLGRRLYKMRSKARSIPLKIAIDDKKASQFMSRAARLNEAFSAVRRIPMVRTSLPAPAGGVTPWPAMSLI